MLHKYIPKPSCNRRKYMILELSFETRRDGINKKYIYSDFISLACKKSTTKKLVTINMETNQQFLLAKKKPLTYIFHDLIICSFYFLKNTVRSFFNAILIPLELIFCYMSSKSLNLI